jgi:hypothetical protein
VESDTTKRTPMTIGKSFFTEPGLKALIDTALVNAFDIKDALARVEMARAGVRLNTGLDKPTVDGLLSLGQRKFGDFTIDGVGNYDTKFSTNLSDRHTHANCTRFVDRPAVELGDRSLGKAQEPKKVCCGEIARLGGIQKFCNHPIGI